MQKHSNAWSGPLATWLLLSLLWIGSVALATEINWPSLPLDMTTPDPATRAAYDAVVDRYVHRAATRAVVLPLIGLVIAVVYAVRSGRRGSMPVASRPAGSGPARIILMRHAEKTYDRDDIHISAAGEERAKRLVTYIPETFGKPDFIFAAARSKHSIRSIETMTPLAEALGKPVLHDIEDRDFEVLIDQLFSDPTYAGRTVVICWHHGKLPEIAAMLGAPDGAYPDPWPEDKFNLVLDFRYGSDGPPPRVEQIFEPF